MTLIPTPEQQAILHAARSSRTSIMVQAFAGCAKSTTLELVAQQLTSEPALALAFNKKIAVGLEKRLPANFTVKTLNGLGHTAWGRAIGRRCEVDDRKIGRLLTAEAKSQDLELGDAWDNCRRLLSLAMANGLVPASAGKQGLVEDTEESWQGIAIEHMLDFDKGMLPLLRGVLRASIQEAYQGILSFDCQIYMSALFGGAFPRYPLVLVDEAQDLSPLNHQQVRKAAGGRLIVVGDQLQAIYGFRGADSSSMSSLRGLRPDWIDLPLATTFRCPKMVVERQQRHAQGFTAWPKNPQGLFEHWRQPRESHEAGEAWTGWDEKKLLTAAGTGSLAILCRNNAPLLDLAFKLIRRGVGVVMQGRDIGKGLVALSKKILPQDSLDRFECSRLVANWISVESANFRAQGRDEKVSAVTDRGECLLAVLEADNVPNAGALRAKLTALFAREDGRATLSTIHRAKGLEWDCVLLLDPWRVPSKWAKRAGGAALEQEFNLLYVAETRTKDKLVWASLEDFT